MDFTLMESDLSRGRQNFKERDFAEFLQKLQEYVQSSLLYDYNMLEAKYKQLMRHRDILRHVSSRWDNADDIELKQQAISILRKPTPKLHMINLKTKLNEAMYFLNFSINHAYTTQHVNNTLSMANQAQKHFLWINNAIKNYRPKILSELEELFSLTLLDRPDMLDENQEYPSGTTPDLPQPIGFPEPNSTFSIIQPPQSTSPIVFNTMITDEEKEE